MRIFIKLVNFYVHVSSLLRTKWTSELNIKRKKKHVTFLLDVDAVNDVVSEVLVYKNIPIFTSVIPSVMIIQPHEAAPPVSNPNAAMLITATIYEVIIERAGISLFMLSF